VSFRIVALLLLLSACAREEPTILSVTFPTDTRSTQGPYAIHVIARGVTGDDEIVARYSTLGTLKSFLPAKAKHRADDADLYVAGIPGQPAGSTVYFYVALLRDGDVLATDPANAPVTTTEGTEVYSFGVLTPSGACTVDSQCVAGQEICAAGMCRVSKGTCVPTSEGLDCPDGYVCDPTRVPEICVIAALRCETDLDCPSQQECDPTMQACVAR
jgi:hypothetical protein